MPYQAPCSGGRVTSRRHARTPRRRMPDQERHHPANGLWHIRRSFITGTHAPKWRGSYGFMGNHAPKVGRGTIAIHDQAASHGFEGGRSRPHQLPPRIAWGQDLSNSRLNRFSKLWPSSSFVQPKMLPEAAQFALPLTLSKSQFRPPYGRTQSRFSRQRRLPFCGGGAGFWQSQKGAGSSLGEQDS